MSQASAKQPESAFSLFNKSSELVKANLNAFAILYALPFVMGLLSLSNQNEERESGVMWTNGTFKFGPLFGAALTLSLVLAVLYVVAALMMVVLEYKAAHGKTPTLGEVWQDTKKYGWRLVGLGIVVGVLAVVGLILLIVPGVIVISRYFLSAFAMIDKDLGIGDAMRESEKISKGYWGSIWTVIGVAVLISIIGTFGIIGWGISFVLTALYSVAPALRYLELKKLHHGK